MENKSKVVCGYKLIRLQDALDHYITFLNNEKED